MPENKTQPVSLVRGKLGPIPPQMKEFDFIIGDWDVAIRYYAPDGTVQSEEKAKWHGEHRNGGRMVLDEFTRVDPDGTETSCAITLRTFCPDLEEWEMTFLFSQQPGVPQSFRGKFTDGVGCFNTVINLSEETSMIARIYFHDIKPDSFEWKMEQSLDGGKSWIHRQSSSITRRPE